MYYDDMENQTENSNKIVHSIKEVMPSLLVTVVLFAVCLSFGLISPPSESVEMLSDIAETVERLMSLSPSQLLIIIFLNNSIKCLIAMVLGIALGLPPLIFICFNGYLVGLVVAALRSTIDPLIIIASLVPHGIIEIPVLLLSSAMGIAIGFESFKWLVKRESAVRSRLKWCLGIYLKWCILALLAAAIIEIFLTPLLVSLAGGGEIPIGAN
jgi:stage II sporulation protein M